MRNRFTPLIGGFVVMALSPTWTGVSPPSVDTLVRAMAIDPQNPGTIYVGTQGPLFKSTDGGGHWAQKKTGLENAGFVVALAIDPQTPSTVYAGLDAVYKSVDGGETWSQALSAGSQCTALAVDPKNPARVYAGTVDGGGIFKSTDSGGSWKLVPGPLAGFGINALAVDPINPSRVYAATGAGIYRSADAGESWQLAAGTLQTVITALAADPVTSGLVYAASGGVVGRSTDAGQTWIPIQTSPIGTVIGIAIDPHQPATIFAAVYRDGTGKNGAVYKSTDAGATWKICGPGMAANKLYALALDSLDPPNLYVGGIGGGDAFVAKFTPSGQLAYSTYLGGGLDDAGAAIALDGAGGVIVAGRTSSSDFPLKAPLYSALTETSGSFIARIQDTGTSVPEFSTVSAASYAPGGAVAPDSIASGFGVNLAASLTVADVLPLPTFLSERSVTVRDSAGAERLAQLFMVSAGQINYLVPPGTALGMATVTVMNGQEVVASGPLEIRAVAPGLFSANADSQGVAAAQAVQLTAGGTQITPDVLRWDAAANRYVSVPIDLSAGPETVLVLYGTGIRGMSSPSAVQVQVGGVDAPVDYAGPQPVYSGLDQVNVRLPLVLAGRGEVEIALTVDGVGANKVTVNIK